MAKRLRSLTGIQPTGMPHVGNLLGAIEPALGLQDSHEPYYFIASFHALTTTKDPEVFRRRQREVAMTWLAFGLDPERTTLWRQQDVPEVCELAWILSCFTPHGMMERAHAFKAARDRGREVNLGTFCYPVLMAADILLFDSNVVPVGKDQKQHVEMARDIAQAINHRFGGDVFVLPEPAIQEHVASVPGLDGRKMSKSYNNHLPLLLPPKALRKRVMRIVTDSKGMADAKDPDTCTVFALYKLFANPQQQTDLAMRYRKGGLGYGHAKQELFELINARLAEPRERYHELEASPDQVDEILADGAARARKVGRSTLDRVRFAVGLN
jgi:tryptophanyl-tRNA synthetase